jgi:glycerophosphoryl diester phosphodiesterase
MVQVGPLRIKGVTCGSANRHRGDGGRRVTRVFAHRGDTSSAVENTVPAFLAAVAAGADGVELDVRRSADGALVVHHDALVDGRGPICELRVRDLPDHVALLEEALTVLEPISVNVEIKNGSDEPGYDPSGSISHDVVSLVEDLGAIDRVLVSSFDLPTLDAARQASSSIATGWLLGYAAEAHGALAVALAHGMGAVHPWVLTVDGPLVELAHESGLEVNTWTVNARHDLKRMVTLGVDAVITDDIALGLEVVRAQHTTRNGGSVPGSA